MDSAVHPQQIQALLELENDLHDALVVAQARHDETLSRMDSSRQLIETLLLNEAQETRLYVEDTMLEMRAIRDVVVLEMENAKREVEKLLREAAGNISNVREAREAQLAELAEKTQELQTQRLVQKKEVEEAIAEVKWQTEVEERRLWEEIQAKEDTHGSLAITTKPHSGAVASTDDCEVLDGSRDAYGVWGWPLIACLVVGACLWVFFLTKRAGRENEERRRRILYSEQLRSHFADRGESSKAKPVVDSPLSPEAADEITAPTPDTVPAPRRRPTLRRRLRPGWSPTASTASTASSPDEANVLDASSNPEPMTPHGVSWQLAIDKNAPWTTVIRHGNVCLHLAHRLQSLCLPSLWVQIVPKARRNSEIGNALFQATQEIGKTFADAVRPPHDPDTSKAPVVDFWRSQYATTQRVKDLFTANGYSTAKCERIEFTKFLSVEQPTKDAAAKGVVVKPFDLHGDDLAQMYSVWKLAYGEGTHPSIEAWKFHYLQTPRLAPELCFVAWDGDTPVSGVFLEYIIEGEGGGDAEVPKLMRFSSETPEEESTEQIKIVFPEDYAARQAKIRANATSAYVCAVATLPEYRGKPLARALMLEAFEKAQLLGLEKVFLSTNTVNTAAIKAYTAGGMVETNRMVSGTMTIAEI